MLLTKAGFFCRFLFVRLRGDPLPLPDDGGLPLTVPGGGGGGGGGPGGQGGGGAVLQPPQTTPGLPGEGQAGPDPLGPEVLFVLLSLFCCFFTEFFPNLFCFLFIFFFLCVLMCCIHVPGIYLFCFVSG